VAGRRLETIYRFLTENAMNVVDIRPVTMDRRAVRALWHKHLDKAPLAIAKMVDLDSAAGPFVMFSLIGPRDSTDGPAATALGRRKGRAAPTRDNGTLRSQLEITAPVMNFVHTPDTQERVFTELALLLPEADHNDVIARLAAAKELDPSDVHAAIDDLYRAVPAHHLDPARSAALLAGRTGDVLVARVAAALDHGRELPADGRSDLIFELAALTTVPVWDRITLIAHIIGDSRVTFGTTSTKTTLSTTKITSSTYVERFAVFGDIGHQYPIMHDSGAPFVVCRLPNEASTATRAVEHLRPEDTVGDVLLVIDGQDSILSNARDLPVWQGTAFHPDFIGRLAAAFEQNLVTTDVRQLAPLMVLRRHVGADPLTEVLMCTRMRAAGALFTRVARMKAGREQPWDAIVRSALAESDAFQTNVLTETEGCVKLSPNVEIETKLALTSGVSPWALASRLSTLVGTDALPGFIPDVGNELQRWQTYQHTWEVLAPADDVGYLALIHSGSGRYDLKRKRFGEDGLRREETFRFNVGVHDSVRDGNVESAETGHFFGLEIDEVTLDDAAARLSQLEVEYHRSRVHDGLAEDSIEPELMRLTLLVKGLLSELGEPAELTYYSKLSFLRDIVETGRSRFAMPA
jgi:hypothetical protein